MLIHAIAIGLLGIIGITSAFVGADKRDTGYFMLGIMLVFAAGIVFGIGITDTDDSVRYIPAEIVATNDTSTYFGTPDGHIYAVETRLHYWPDDVPYLLDVNTNGTDDKTDDEVLVVWRAE